MQLVRDDYHFQICRWSHFSHNLFRNDFIIKVRILELIKWSYSFSPPDMLAIEPRMLNKFWGHSSCPFKYTYFECPFLEPHLTTPLKYRCLIMKSNGVGPALLMFGGSVSGVTWKYLSSSRAAVSHWYLKIIIVCVMAYFAGYLEFRDDDVQSVI